MTDTTNWQEITTQAQADTFMRLVNDFHDAYIREIHASTGEYVNDDLAMHVGTGLDTRVRILLQRQDRPLSAIELLFEGVLRVNWIPSSENHESIIFQSTLSVHDSNIYWADRTSWVPNQEDRDKSTWITARRLY